LKTFFQRTKKCFNRKIFDLLVIVLSNFLIFRNFFIQPGLLVQGVDALMWATITRYYENFRWLHLWYHRSSFGYVKQSASFENLLGIAYTITKDPYWTFRVLILAIGIFGSIGMYAYIYHRTKRNNSALFGALFYILNPWFLSEIQAGHLALLTSMALFPFLLYTFDMGQVLPTSIFASLFLSSAHPQALYVFGLFFIASSIEYIRLNREKIIYFLKICSCSFALSTFYLIPFLFVSRFSGYYGMTSHWMIEDITEFVVPQSWALLLLTLNILLFTVTWFFRKKYQGVRFHIFASFLGTFIAVSPSFPFLNFFYLYMFQNVHFFSIFRVPSRFFMIVALCDAYLIGVAFSGVSGLKTVVGHTKLFKLPISRTLKIIAIALIALTIAFSWLQLPYTSPGNYDPNPEWIAQYDWLRAKDGDWRVDTLGGKYYWINTPWGMTQEYGKLSTLFTDKPVIGVPIEASSSFFFLKYLEYVVANNITDQWLKIVGAFDVKYVTLASYAPDQYNFLHYQTGIREGIGPVYIYRSAEVYENPYWMPLIRVVPKIAYVVSGYRSITALQHRPDFEMDCLGYRLVNPRESFCLNESSVFIYEDPSFMDYLMLTYENGVNLPAYQYSFEYSRDPSKYWVKNDSWIIQGKFVFNDFTLSTIGNRSLSIPFSARESGVCDIWVRMLAGLPNQGYLTINNVTICPKWITPIFKWVKFGQIYISSGEQTLHVSNLGGRNDIDAIMLTKSKDLEGHISNVTNQIQRYAGKILFLNSAHNIFSSASNSNWEVLKTYLLSSDGYILHSDVGGELNTNLYIPKNASYSFVLRANTTNAITLQINDFIFHNISLLGNGYREISFGPVYLERGNHTVSLKFDGTTDLDQFAFYTIKNEPEQLGSLSAPDINVFHHKVSPSEYIAYYNSSYPCYLIFSNSYDPSWKAYVSGFEVQPMKMYGGVCGFHINQTGEVTVRLVFTAQKFAYIGFGIGLVAWCMTGTFIVIKKMSRKFEWREYYLRLKSKLSRALHKVYVS